MAYNSRNINFPRDPTFKTAPDDSISSFWPSGAFVFFGGTQRVEKLVADFIDGEFFFDVEELFPDCIISRHGPNYIDAFVSDGIRSMVLGLGH